MSDEPRPASKAEQAVELWLKAAVIALFVALAPLRVLAKIFDFGVPI